MSSIILTELDALALRHRFVDRLNGRADIVAPRTVTPTLSRRIDRYLVSGLDYDGEPGMGGWPVPTGGRYVKLCFSPTVQANLGEASAGQPYRLPLTLLDYMAYVERITGLGPDCDEALIDVFRFTPAWLFEATETMRVQCPEAWVLLLSNEFDLACKLWKPLRSIVEGSPFRHGLIHGFMILAEFERAHLIMRHLARARAIIDRPKFLEALQSSLPLSSWFKPNELREIYRWLEYACLSSGALRDFVMDRTDHQIASLPAGYPLWAAARGVLPGPASAFGDHPQVREIMAKVFVLPPLPPSADGSKPPVERKRPMLRDHTLLRWYGQTNAVLPLIVLDGVRDVYPTRRVPNLPSNRQGTTASTSARPQLVALASAIRASADPALHAELVAAAENYIEGSRKFAGADVALDGNRKLGLKMAKRYLPPRMRGGSGARFDPTMWSMPTRDAGFWRMFVEVRRSGRLYRSPHARFRTMMRQSLGILRRAFGPLFTRLTWSDETARIVCDLACAIGPISANPQIAYAIQQLERKPSIIRRLGNTVRRPGYGHGKKSGAAAKITRVT
ncbi:MAG: hypothetical protein KYX69_02770 [Sphingomonas sp.]|uniref:hypothetical protein n=1 Tax=Sphingomonas sp. TaxID=28214 RepID=UPI0026390D36|nr:hypothetical protein [Sphingomonas sp.]MDK2766622.1 hypothetical protein [Sphingomonas sp.]